MPSIVYIYPPHSPVRRLPKSVQMNIIEPSPWACSRCKGETIAYADGVVWCKKCEKRLLDAERVDISRGEQTNTEAPSWRRTTIDELSSNILPARSASTQ